MTRDELVTYYLRNGHAASRAQANRLAVRTLASKPATTIITPGAQVTVGCDTTPATVVRHEDRANGRYVLVAWGTDLISDGEWVPAMQLKVVA